MSTVNCLAAGQHFWWVAGCRLSDSGDDKETTVSRLPKEQRRLVHMDSRQDPKKESGRVQGT